MYTTTLASAYAFQLPSISRPRRTLTATVLFALGALVGWPFAIAVAIPFVFEEIFLLGADRVNPQGRAQWAVKRLTRLVGCGLTASLILVRIILICYNYILIMRISKIPCILIDSYAYGQFTVAPWTIVRYNVFGGSERGPDLYGTSPWHFYFQNLALNFNIASIAALLSLPALGITYLFDRRRLGLRAQANETSPFSSLAIRLAPFYVWMTILTAQPHKEERFMYPVYPLICFNAGTTLYLARGWIEVVYIKATNSPYKVGC
jgi:alpha-1,2-mannosyltransferase